MIQIVEDPVDESMSGTLWLFTCAISSAYTPVESAWLRFQMADPLVQGGVLILIALRSWAWSKPKSRTQYAIYITQMIIGLGIGLLGLLDIGSRQLVLDGNESGRDRHLINPLYVLLEKRLPLFVVLGAYGLGVVLEVLIGRISAKR